jgi:hypothetical protein
LSFSRPSCFKQDAEKVRQLRSRLKSILNVAQGYASGAFIGCGLAGRSF